MADENVTYALELMLRNAAETAAKLDQVAKPRTAKVKVELTDQEAIDQLGKRLEKVSMAAAEQRKRAEARTDTDNQKRQAQIASDEARAESWAQAARERQARDSLRSIERDRDAADKKRVASLRENIRSRLAAEPARDGPGDMRRSRWTSDYNYASSRGASGPEAFEYATLRAAKGAEEFRKQFTELKEPLSGFGRMMKAIGEGGIRRGVAVGITEGLGGGAMAQMLGGFGGAFASSLVLPLAWALGNLVMNLPKTVAGEVGAQRYAETLLVRAQGGKQGGGKAWQEETAKTRRWAGQFWLGNDEKWGDTAVQEFVGAYQMAGPQPKNTEEEMSLARRANLAAAQGIALSAGASAHVKPGDLGQLAVAMRDLDTANVDRAREYFMNQSWVQDEWLKRHAKGDKPEIALARMQEALKNPQSTYTRIYKNTGAVSATSREEIQDIIQSVSAEQRVQGVLQQQSEQTRMPWNQRGGMGLFPDVTTLPNAEQHYIEVYKRLLNRKGQLSASQYAQELQQLRKWGSEKYPESLFEAKPPNLTRERMAELERYGGYESDVSSHPALQARDRNAEFRTPSQYSWTSFSGLAEQMQMMWSGAPSLETSAEKLSNVADKLNAFADKTNDPHILNDLRLDAVVGAQQ